MFESAADLGRFQTDLSRLLLDLSAQIPAPLTVYRNTVLKGMIDALLANFPTAERLVGSEWLSAAAREFALAHPPRVPSLLAYGAEFPAWLRGFAPARELP